MRISEAQAAGGAWALHGAGGIQWLLQIKGKNARCTFMYVA
jgi:hypothetical protein